MTTVSFCQINRENIAKIHNKGHNSVNLSQLFLHLNSRTSIPNLYQPSKNERAPYKITQVIALTDRQDENIPLHNKIVLYLPISRSMPVAASYVTYNW